MTQDKRADCRSCIHHGSIVDSYIHCHKILEEVEPDPQTGGFSYAEDCTFYVDKDGNTNPKELPCPSCGSRRLITEIGNGHAVIICTDCDHRLDTHGHIRRSEAIRAWNERTTGGE